MIEKTKGIVLDFIRYRETSVIVKIYTEEFGLKSYLVNGARSSKNKSNPMAFFQPLTMLNLVVYNRPSGLNRIKEMSLEMAFQSIPFEIKKTSIAMFLVEMLSKSLREEEKNDHLFQFIQQSLLFLDHCEADYENFHIQFLFGLTHFLGIAIESSEEIFSQLQDSGITVNQELSEKLHQIIQGNYLAFVKLNGKTRSILLNYLIRFFQIHLENFGEIKSLNILKQINS